MTASCSGPPYLLMSSNRAKKKGKTCTFAIVKTIGSIIVVAVSKAGSCWQIVLWLFMFPYHWERLNSCEK